MPLTDSQADRWLEDLRTGWVSLHHANPDINGGLESEINGGGYERVSVLFTEPSNRVIWNDSTLKFRGLPASTISFIGLWAVQYNGRMLWYMGMEDAERVTEGSSFTIKPGEIAVSLA